MRVPCVMDIPLPWFTYAITLAALAIFGLLVDKLPP